MAFVHGKGTKVHVNAVDFSQYFNNVDVTKTADVAETTNFGSSGAKSPVIPPPSPDTGSATSDLVSLSGGKGLLL